MTKKLKFVSILVILSMVFTFMSGCDNDKNDASKKGVSKDGGSNAQDNVDSKDNDELPKVYIFQNIGKIQSAGKPGSNAEDLEEVRKIIMEKSKIEPVVIIPPKGGEQEKLNILLASNDPIDIFWGWWPDYQAKGAIQPINDALEKYGQDAKKIWPEDAWKGMTDKDGNIWGIPRSSPLTGYPVFLRTDWLDELGLQMPKTIDELENVLKAFKEKDPAGNGQTIPFVGDLNGLKMSLAAGFMDIGAGNWVDSDGKVKPIEINPGYKDFVAKMADWYQKGYLFKETFSSNRDRFTELMKQNKIGGLGYWCSLTTIQSPYLKQTVPTANYDMAKFLKGPKGLCETQSNVSASGALIPKKSKNVEAAIKYLNWGFEDIENHIIAEEGIEGKHWKYTDKAEHVIEVINEDYIGEFVATQGLATERLYSFSDPIRKMENDYIHNDMLAFDRTKKPGDFGMIYDANAINNAVPTKGDIDRMIDEEITKFIMGVRPIDQYDEFIDELYKAGLDKLIDEWTNQYNKTMSN